MDLSNIVGPDVETTVNAKGGAQSDIPVRFDLIDGLALFEMAKVLAAGAEKYGENNWRLIDVEDHLNHLIMHAYAWLSGDRTDDHLSHIMCRATFAQAVDLQEDECKTSSTTSITKRVTDPATIQRVLSESPPPSSEKTEVWAFETE